MKGLPSLMVCVLCLLTGCGGGGSHTAATFSLGTPSATSSFTSLNFPDESVGQTYGPVSVFLNNTGTVALNVQGISTTGDFGETNNCTSSVPTGGNCKILVTFAPTTAGSHTGMLSVADNAVGSQTISLSGNGVTPPPGCRQLQQSCSQAAQCCPGLECVENRPIGTGSSCVQVPCCAFIP